MAYKSNFNEDPEIELRFLVEVSGSGRDEVDARSRYVINLNTALLPKYVLHKGFFPQRPSPLEFRAEREVNRRLKKISDKKLQILKVRPQHAGVLSLISTEQALDEREQQSFATYLKEIYPTGQYKVLYQHGNQVLLHIDSEETFVGVGEKILSDLGLNIIPNKRLLSLEALESVPNYFLELSTSRNSSEEIQRHFSEALGTFCGVFKYLRLQEDDQESVTEQRPGCFPAISLTLMFVRMAHENARTLGTLLASDQGFWRSFHPPEAVSGPNEPLFALQKHPGPLLGLKSGCPFPGVRVSVTFSQNLEAMEMFYKIITGVQPVPRDDPKTGTSYRIFPITGTFELQLVYNASVQVENVDNIRFCVRITDQQSISAALSQPLTCIGAGHWEARDPVGTRVMLFTVVE